MSDPDFTTKILGYYVVWKHKLETNEIENIKKIGNNRFRLETKKGHWKQSFGIGNKKLRLETQKLDWKQNKYIHCFQSKKNVSNLTSLFTMCFFCFQSKKMFPI